MDKLTVVLHRLQMPLKEEIIATLLEKLQYIGGSSDYMYPVFHLNSFWRQFFISLSSVYFVSGECQDQCLITPGGSCQ
jgi:hypothetical protein